VCAQCCAGGVPESAVISILPRLPYTTRQHTCRTIYHLDRSQAVMATLYTAEGGRANRNADHQSADLRAPVDRPWEDPSVSYWLAHHRDNELIGHGKTDALPEAAEVVIIGSGMSGTLTGHPMRFATDPYSVNQCFYCRYSMHLLQTKSGSNQTI
jgi:hypothetical protein